jgi:uncharacterized oxidoreductase
MPTAVVAWLERAVERVFTTARATPEEARGVAAHLVEAEACGVRSHGLQRVPQYLRAIGDGRITLGAKLTTLRDGPSTAALDGGKGFGVVMARAAMARAIDKAAATGVAAVTLVNCGHTGRLGSYTEQAARAGCVGMMMVNGGGAGQWVAPHGGRAGRFATNPISIGVPAEDQGPLLVDLSTSAAAEGKVRAHRTEGRPIPEGWVITNAGEPTTDPSALYTTPRGALLPVGGHKGYALALAVDALAGALSGAGCCTEADRPLEGTTDGVFMLAVRVDAFRPLADFRDEVGDLLAHVRSCPPAPGSAGVQSPGDPEAKARAASARDGIAISNAAWEQLRSAVAPLGLRWDSAGD